MQQLAIALQECRAHVTACHGTLGVPCPCESSPMLHFPSASHSQDLLIYFFSSTRQSNFTR
jgi:hypothetical protein